MLAALWYVFIYLVVMMVLLVLAFNSLDLESFLARGRVLGLIAIATPFSSVVAWKVIYCADHLP